MAVRIGAGREEELQCGCARFAEWRQTGQRGEPVPVKLRELAGEHAERFGLSRTSQALPVGYYALQARGADCGQTSDDSKSFSAGDCSPETPSPKFVELPAATLGAPVECMVEFEKPGGAKLWIQVRS